MRKITSGQIFGKETTRFLDELEQSQEPQIILVVYSWWDRLVEKVLRMLFCRF